MHHLVLSLRRRALRSAAVLGLAAAAAFVVACGGSAPATPEELVARMAAATAAGRYMETWDLATDDFRRGWVQGIETLRRDVKRNPGIVGFISQYNCTPEEFHILTPEALWVRHHAGGDRQRALDGARVVDKHPDPQRPSDLIVDIENVYGARIRWVLRPTGSGGYALQSAVMVKSVEQATPRREDR